MMIKLPNTNKTGETQCMQTTTLLSHHHVTCEYTSKFQRSINTPYVHSALCTPSQCSRRHPFLNLPPGVYLVYLFYLRTQSHKTLQQSMTTMRDCTHDKKSPPVVCRPAASAVQHRNGVTRLFGLEYFTCVYVHANPRTLADSGS